MTYRIKLCKESKTKTKTLPLSLRKECYYIHEIKRVYKRHILKIKDLLENKDKRILCPYTLLLTSLLSLSMLLPVAGSRTLNGETSGSHGRRT